MRVATDAYAITSESFRLEGAGVDWSVDEVLGEARVEATPADGDDELFVGIAPTSQALSYLDGVGYDEIDELSFRWDDGVVTTRRTDAHPGGAPTQSPTDLDIWAASASGPGTQQLTWRTAPGRWS